MCWSFLPHVRFLILLTVFELLPKTCNFTICSIFSNSGHVGWCTASPDTILKLDTLVMIQTKFGFHWSSTFRGEDFWKSLRHTTDDGRQVMRIAHMTLWVRWAKNQLSRQTGSRNLTYMMLVTKYQISAINSYWEKCDEKYLGRTDRGKTVYPPPPSGSGGIKKKTEMWKVNADNDIN